MGSVKWKYAIDLFEMLGIFFRPFLQRSQHPFCYSPNAGSNTCQYMSSSPAVQVHYTKQILTSVEVESGHGWSKLKEVVPLLAGGRGMHSNVGLFVLYMCDQWYQGHNILTCQWLRCHLGLYLRLLRVACSNNVGFFMLQLNRLCFWL